MEYNTREKCVCTEHLCMKISYESSDSCSEELDDWARAERDERNEKSGAEIVRTWNALAADANTN